MSDAADISLGKDQFRYSRMNFQPPMEPGTTRYRAFEALYLRMGESQQLVYSPLTREARLLTNTSTRLLRECRSAATLSAHAANLCARLGLDESRLQQVREELAKFAASGMLVSEQNLLERCLDGATPRPQKSAITTVAICSRGRTLELAKHAAAFAAAKSALRPSIRFLVADDAADAADSRGTVDQLKAVKKRFGGDFWYIDSAAKRGFATELTERAQIDPEIVRSALFNDDSRPLGIVGDRNALLLATVGELTMQVDANVDCEVLRGTGAADGITLTSTSDPTSFWLEDESINPVGEDGDMLPRDVCSVHEELLGKPLAACLDEYRPESIETGGVAASFLRRLREGSGKVQMTSLGTVGDLGPESEFGAISVGGLARDRVLRSADAYRQLVRFHRGIRGVDRTTITDSPLGTGATTGLDNREPLCPFGPFEGKQDSNFAHVIAVTSNGLFGHLPWTTRRAAPKTVDDPHGSARLQSGDIIEALVGLFERAPAAGVERSLADLGALLCELGTLPQRDFDELVLRTVLTQAVHRIQFLDRLIIQHRGEPQFWADHATDYLSALRNAIAQEDYVIPSDLRIAFGNEGARSEMQHLVLKFGQLLLVWMRLREAALELRVLGHELGRRI